jgi:flagellar biosynthetic protein FlhB
LPEDNKSEKATVRQKQKARDRGQVARSRDLVSALTLLSVTTALLFVSRMWIGIWRDFLVRILAAGSHPGTDFGTSVFSWTAVVVARGIAPILLLGFVISIAAATAQGGFVFAPEAFTPNFNRLNPVTNLGAIFSISGLSRLLRSLIPGSGIVYIAYSLIHREMPEFARLAQLGSGPILAKIAALWFELSWKCGLVLLAWSGADYGFQHWNYERGLRMTKQEVKDEAKSTDGNPATRGRRRNLRRALLRKILAKEMARATAVITNPTHYAVALEYRPESMPAPVVVAKGRDLLAARIRELARQHEVPILENPPLARTLYKMAKVGQSIPPQLYTAVAEILAFLYRSQRRMQGMNRGGRA